MVQDRSDVQGKTTQYLKALPLDRVVPSGQCGGVGIKVERGRRLEWILPPLSWVRRCVRSLCMQRLHQLHGHLGPMQPEETEELNPGLDCFHIGATSPVKSPPEETKPNL